jgi:exodeoxyribonuclease VII large subunit
VDVLSLYELNTLIRTLVETSFDRTFLVTAEIASCDVKNHCYLVLVDKKEDSIRAEIRAVIWANRFRSISRAFEKSTGVPVARGIKILFEAEVSFHERYGLKLNILNIDPSYTVGELAVRRKEILERLSKEELIDRNREREFPLVPRRIGIISSSSSAGYDDLMNHLTGNAYGYIFTCSLYEAVMQGDRAEASIISAMKQCADDADSLDLVVIVRGGGGQTDLHCFDSYEIGKAIALLPLPVISGIGHHRDITVVDEVSNRRAKTPTAVADMILAAVRDYEENIDTLAQTLVHGTRNLTLDLTRGLTGLARRLEIASGNAQLRSHHQISTYIKDLKFALKRVQNEKLVLKSKEGILKMLDPKHVLKRGYSISYNNGIAVKSVSDLKKGDNLRTVVYDGEIISSVSSKKKTRRKK